MKNSFKINPETTCIFTTYEPAAFKAKLKRGEKIPTCKKRTVLSSACLKSLIADDGKPRTFSGNWKNTNKKTRLEANLEYMADGKKFTYEIIN